MNKEEYYNRVKKTRIKEMTDRTSRDEDYQISCQINYLSKRYIETLENALDEIEKYINKAQLGEFPDGVIYWLIENGAKESNERYFGNPQFDTLYDLIKDEIVEKVSDKVYICNYENKAK